jgi:predicted nucleotide-binding protein
MGALSEKLNQLVDFGYRVDDHQKFRAWMIRVENVLTQSVGPEIASEFAKTASYSSWEQSIVSKIGMLEGMALKSEMSSEESKSPPPPGRVTPTPNKKFSNRVFVVHGHDSEIKESVARFIERIGLEPIVLHEQPNGGRTIIEKFEAHADVGFAVVLLSPDDLGASVDDAGNLKHRARQNVVLELGYFMGTLTRKGVCAIKKPGVETPSDIQGVIYLDFDPAGAWRTKLAQEFVEAGYTINLERLLGS